MTNQNNGVNPVVAAVTGAVVGAAAVGIAGAAILANDDNRKKVEKFIDSAKDKAEDIKENVSEKIADAQERVSEVIDTAKGPTKNTPSKAK